MADNNTPVGDNSAAIASDDGVSLPRIKMGETGFSALKVRNGRIYEEVNTAFQMPHLTRVVSEMQYSPSVSIGLGAQNTLISRAEVVVTAVTGETDTDKVRREYLQSVLHDMENSFQSTLQNIATCKEWGHQVSEMVFRRRLTANGSKYNDGLIGLSKLAHRPQPTIIRWNYDDSGRNLQSISQSIANLENASRFYGQTDNNGLITIPREKFLLFRSDSTSDNPLGVSCLRSCYLAYKQLTLLEEHMLKGVSKDTSGIPFAQIHPKYLDPNANAADKAVATQTQTILDNIADGISKGIIFPTLKDTEGNDLFSLSLLEQKSGKAYDLPLIIRQLQSNILSVLSADSITMGSDKAGSFSLQDGSTNLLALRVSLVLSQIADTLNQSLVPLLWKMNGWKTDRLPKITFSDLSTVDIETFTKGVQRIASTSMVEVNRGVLNKIYGVMGFPLRPDDEPVNKEELPAYMTGQVSSGGEGMSIGTSGKGTATNSIDNGQNTSDNNADNKG